MSGKRKPYSGILLEPIESHQKQYAMFIKNPDELVEEVQAGVERERHKRFMALAEHYGLDVDVTTTKGKEALLLALAENHVAGFKVVDGVTRKGRGRPSQWKGMKGFLLWHAVESIKAVEGISGRKACKMICKDGKGEFAAMTPEALHTRYQEANADNHYLTREVKAAALKHLKEQVRTLKSKKK